MLRRCEPNGLGYVKAPFVIQNCFQMAKQNGIIPLKGTIGNITFYKSKAGHLAYLPVTSSGTETYGHAPGQL